LPQKSGDEHVAFFKTNGYMNISGSPVKSAFDFCEVWIYLIRLKQIIQLENIKDIIVVVDDLDQGFGKFRIKNGGSAK